jgi:glycine cleavage system H protein
MKVGEYEIREGLHYTKEHEWVRKEGNSFFLGITDYAAKEMGDVAFVELPPTGTALGEGDLLCEIESVKAVSEVRSPGACKVEEVNDDLNDEPELINEAPYDSWLVKLSCEDDLEGLLSADDYKVLLESLTETT